LEFASISEVLGQSPIGHYVFNCQAPDIGNMELLHRFASEDLKVKYLHPLQKGEIRSCFAMTEPEHAGSNPIHLSTRAELDGDEYVINGHKWFTSSADGAYYTIVMAVTDPDNTNPYQRASMILVPLDNPGYRLIRNIPIMGDVGEDYLSHGEVEFKDCRVHKSYLIGEAGSGFALAQERLGPGRIHHCMRWIGICERVLELTCKRAATRELNPNHVLADQQSIQHGIAESAAEIKASRLMVLQTAYLIEKYGAKAAKEDISTIKFYVSNVLMRVIDKAIQVHGALGITDDTLLSFWYRHERGAKIYDGPDEVHKTVLAKRIIQSYAAR
jgi:alkylation response protein AidB-like acyl-CoA dehydrogenase